jgi:glutathione S-transferase
LHNADSLIEYWTGDFSDKKFSPLIFSHVFNPNADAKERDEKFAEVVKDHLPAALAVVERRLPSDSKFLLGDKISVYDIRLGYLMTIMYQDKEDDKLAVMKAGVKEQVANLPKTKAFVENYMAELKGYLEKRPKCTI